MSLTPLIYKQEIKKCVRNSLNSDIDQISSSRLPQLKSYLKIVGILYLVNQSNTHITLEDIEKIFKNNYIFNNIILASKYRIIKVFPKLDMAIIWINIWDTQNSFIAKSIINRWFHIGSFITIVCGANINLKVLQCKNCWKWGHSAGVYYIQRSKCVKYNGLHQTIHYHQFAWCCKANGKINPPKLETKKGEPYPYSFRCLNCKDKHQVDSTDCPFWNYKFNKEWHSKEYTKL